ncbi:MAG TPA: hypothetical protein VFR78_21575 [Pyrinomonadaceae bacterium]|nr:hypothetical protein [Pyrinomonadaceae bacterium]
MFSNRIDLGVPLALIEVLARVGSVASITLLLMLFAGDALHPSQVAPREWVGLFFFPFGVIVGMAIAWWREGLGAAITFGSLLGLYLIYGYLMQYHVGGWAFVVFASPAFLFLLHWAFSGAEEKHALG